MSDKARFEAGSASIWRLLQRQIDPRRSHRLKPLTFQHTQPYAEDDQLLFNIKDEPHFKDEFLYEDDEDNFSSDDENLFDIIEEFEMNEEEEDFESDEDLFQQDQGVFQTRSAHPVRESSFDHELLNDLHFLPTEEDIFAAEDLFQCGGPVVAEDDEEMLI